MTNETLSLHKRHDPMVCVRFSGRVGNVPCRNRRMAKAPTCSGCGSTFHAKGSSSHGIQHRNPRRTNIDGSSVEVAVPGGGMMRCYGSGLCCRATGRKRKIACYWEISPNH